VIDQILLVRHARSLANDDPRVWRTMPDHVIPMARPADDEQAIAAGRTIGALGLDPARTCSWSSTYLRCAQTEALVLRTAFGDVGPRIKRRTSFLLREQEFGDWDSLSEAEMEADDPARYARRRLLSDAFGRFYFRYPMGESRADVTQRVTLFIGKLHRTRYTSHLVFLHGVTQRAFRMAWLNLSVEWFEEEPNPPNASVLRIARGPDDHWGEAYL
jgi:broad specificity phosphatase PhoE